MTNPANAFQIERWDTAHSRWSELAALQAHTDLRLFPTLGDFHFGIYTLVALVNDEVVGILRFWTQAIGVDEDQPIFQHNLNDAIEAKVIVLFVKETNRRAGIGTTLQFAAIKWAKGLGCYQLRSRSEYKLQSNHHLKAKLGFGISPGRHSKNATDDTAYFVLPLQLSDAVLQYLLAA